MENYHIILIWIQNIIAICGVFVISIGVIIALGRYIRYTIFSLTNRNYSKDINFIKLTLGRSLTLGLEFIVAADLISTTTTPDYYKVGIVAIIVLIRTFLSYTLNREINQISRLSHHDV